MTAPACHGKPAKRRIGHASRYSGRQCKSLSFAQGLGFRVYGAGSRVSFPSVAGCIASIMIHLLLTWNTSPFQPSKLSLNICWYHQDLRKRLFRAGLHVMLQYKLCTLLITGENATVVGHRPFVRLARAETRGAIRRQIGHFLVTRLNR